jgi:subtilase family serine protease
MTAPRRTTSPRPYVLALAAMGLCSALTVAATAPAAASGTALAHRNAWVRNERSVAPLPPGTRALRAVPSGLGQHLDVVLAPRDPAALEAFDAAVATPGSPTFRRYLTPSSFAARFGADPSTVAAARAWLAGRGLAVGPTAADGLVIPLSGTTAAVGRAFGLGLEQVRLPTGGVAQAPTAAPLVPASLAQAVEGVVGLDDVARAVPELTTTAATPATQPTGLGRAPHAIGHVDTFTCGSQIAGSGAVTADDLAQAYSWPVNTGSGVTIGVYELEPYTPSDISTFENCFSPAIATTPQGVSVNGAQVTQGNDSRQVGESALDIDMVLGMAPGAAVKVYVGENGGSGPLDTYLAMVDDTSIDVITTSWGQCEAQTDPAVRGAEAELFEQAVSQGQTITAAAGDSGSQDCYAFPVSRDQRLEVDDPASQPWVTGVGGTTLHPGQSESVWNSGLVEGAGGGGNSTTWTMPSWQVGAGVESPYTKAPDIFTGVQPCAVSAGPGTASCREVPDVSADADPATGYAVWFQGGWRRIGGTSMSSPMWAALFALADQGQAQTVGFADPVLYQAACQTSPFIDITSGNNQPGGVPPSNPPSTPAPPFYPATSGYDMASGLGSPDATALMAVLRSPPGSVCPQISGISATSGPSGGGNTVTINGANLSGVTEVDFGGGNPAGIVSRGASSVTVLAPASPTGGWATTSVLVKVGADTLGYDGRLPYTYVGPEGYWLSASDGGIFAFGQVGFYGSTGGIRLNQPVVGMAPTPSAHGYWEVASDGGIFAFGDAAFRGSMGGRHLNKPVVGMAATPDGGGYWEVASDGGIFAFGDAAFRGSMGGTALNAPVVGIAATPDGAGYWEVASDGGIFAFGDAAFYGSMGGQHLNQPVVALAATPDGGGYWEVASDGGIFAFGDAAFHGSMGGQHLNQPVVGMAATPDGGGYWEVASDGGIFAFGGRYGGFFGSTGSMHLNKPVVGMAAP